MSLEFSNLGVRFGTEKNPFWAVRSADLTIADNEFVSVVGTSGCGKSTLLSVAAGLQDKSEGVALINGHPIDGPGRDRGVVFQSYTLLPWLTAAENIEFALREVGVAKKERKDRTAEMLNAVGLSAFADRYPAELSGGMRQRVAIARVLSYRPTTLLMDEPFGALDALTRQLMQELLVTIWEQTPMTVLFITHDIHEAVFLSDRVVVMTNKPGRVKAEIPIELPRPRTHEMVRSSEFVALQEEVLGHIRAETLQVEHLV
ncbi:ABC transporter ATP-binding protein [Cryobacterium sp.]|jgi:NitT/TauT family transport system ATP-binding protein|uniref:ABC transporter ATP-binding protein n=1 Tax=Cryobacterium sp. TaxID=1926290 RepID=UPI00261881DD|nr:ABC transporter ATP-binding protein [Cryobacterium sp.]MCU1444510.1 cmpD 3 [Cryobacterium sp.]